MRRADRTRGPDRDRRHGRSLVAAQVGQFALAGIIALVIVGLATAAASRRVGQREAISNARATTLVRATNVVQPVLTDAVVQGDPAALKTLDDAVRSSVLDRSLVRVKVWSSTGRIVYSDEPRLIGHTYPLRSDERNALRTGLVDAEISDLSRAENAYERPQHKLLEVYLPVQTPSGHRLLFEAYYRYGAVVSGGSQLWRNFAPISLGALVMLELVQIPLAWSLAHRLRQRQRDRERLLQRALDASEVERRQIASDLHDGVVQDLAGVSYALAAAARTGEGQPAETDWEGAASTVREAIASLRSLVVDLYPPNLAEEGLASAVRDLLARAEREGLTARLDTTAFDATATPMAVAALLYRATQEGLRNVSRHASATAVAVRLATDDEQASVEVTDDGQGVDGSILDERAGEGHVGLLALRGLVGDAGGRLTFRSAPGQGSTLRVEVPV